MLRKVNFASGVKPIPTLEDTLLPIGPSVPTLGGSSPSFPIETLWRLGITGCIIALFVLLFMGVGSNNNNNSDASFAKYQNFGVRLNESAVNNTLERSMVEINVIDGDDYVKYCSGFFVTETGIIATANHCFHSSYVNCDWINEDGAYDLQAYSTFSIHVEVLGLNGTTEKRTLDAQILALSSTLDFMLLKTMPTSYHGPVTIELTSTPFLKFANSSLVRKGDAVAVMSHESEFSKKMQRRGTVADVHKDIGGGDFIWTGDNIVLDMMISQGSSGAPVLNQDGEVIAGPIVRGHNLAGDGDDTILAISSRVISRMVTRMTDPLIAPELPSQNRYLIPTLGFIVLNAVAIEYRTLYDYNPTNQDYIPYTENKGVAIDILYTQDFWEFFANDIMSCNILHTVEPPSLLNAVLQTTIGGGTPPTPFPGDPKFSDANVMVIVKQIERNLNQEDWIDIGTDAGTESVTGILVGSGKWGGDVVRIRIASFDPFDDTNPVTNWEGIYLVTLRHVDVYWDSLGWSETFLSGGSVHVDENNTMYKSERRTRSRLLHGQTPLGKKREAARSVIKEPPPGMDITKLPTLSQKYAEFRQRRYPQEKANALAGKQRRDAAMAKKKNGAKREKKSVFAKR